MNLVIIPGLVVHGGCSARTQKACRPLSLVAHGVQADTACRAFQVFSINESRCHDRVQRRVRLPGRWPEPDLIRTQPSARQARDLPPISLKYVSLVLFFPLCDECDRARAIQLQNGSRLHQSADKSLFIPTVYNVDILSASLRRSTGGGFVEGVWYQFAVPGTRELIGGCRPAAEWSRLGRR